MFGFIKPIFKMCMVIALLYSKPIISAMPLHYGTPMNSDISIISAMPVVVLHGLDSSSEELNPLCDWIKDTFDVNVFNLEIGNGDKTSLYTPLTYQLEELCETIYGIDELKDGFNFIGMSQGGLLARGYVEQCNLYPVINLITLVTPHGGEYISTIHFNLYTNFFQNYLSIAGYWRDPQQLDQYLSKCRYLPILNNEIQTAESDNQLNQMKSLMNFVLIWSPYDTVLSPAESGKFSFFSDNFKIIDLFDTDLYKKDLLGLKYLDEEDRLHIYETNCSHTDHRNPVCFSQLYPIFIEYL